MLEQAPHPAALARIIAGMRGGGSGPVLEGGTLDPRTQEERVETLAEVEEAASDEHAQPEIQIWHPQRQVLNTTDEGIAFRTRKLLMDGHLVDLTEEEFSRVMRISVTAIERHMTEEMKKIKEARLGMQPSKLPKGSDG